MPRAVAGLPRRWWFPDLPGYRSHERGTYISYVLNEQPTVVADDQLSWLEAQPEVEWAIVSGEPGQQTRPLTTDTLAAMTAGLSLPPSLRKFADRQDLQRRVRSATACYLDVGDTLATTSAGGHLLHFLSDQQWCRHWLIHLDGDGGEAVMTTDAPIGFFLDDDPGEILLPDVIPMDGSLCLEVCADSFAEFLYRFWIENELWFALQGDDPLPSHLAAYAARLPAANQ